MASVQSAAPPLRGEVTEEEWQLRVDLAACYRIIADFGWDDWIFTHFSARVPGPATHFLINPFGLLFEEITASNLIKVGLDGLPVYPTNYLVNPAGFVIHSAIHGARDDARCVLHVHTREGLAVAAQKRGLLPISQIALTIMDDLAYHDYEGIVLDAEEKERLLPALGEKSNLILRNHGLLTVGTSVGEAFLRLYALQTACEAQVLAQAGGEVIELEPELAARVGGQAMTGFEALIPLSWDAALRRAERLDPGFRE